MAMVTSMTCNTNLPKTLSFENSSTHREASFSSYLNGNEKTLALKLMEPSQNINSLLSNSHEQIYIGKKKVEDREIGVFSAEKYFKGAMDDTDENPKTADKITTNKVVNMDPVKPRTEPGTPSAGSVSSLNSQSTLLPRNQQRGEIRKVHKKNFLSTIGCGCSCNDENSVDIDDESKAIEEETKKASDLSKKESKLSTKKTSDLSKKESKLSMSKIWDKEQMNCKKFDEMGIGLKNEECFSFPILNSSKQGNPVVTGDDNATRKSLEVFGSSALVNGKKSSSSERKKSMLSWENVATPRTEETEFPRNQDVMYNDTESDASSDLFEIESFSNKSSSFLARQTSDGNCYAPSEASIAWSVVTASAADFSIMSDSEELGIPINLNKLTKSAKSALGLGKEVHKRRPSILLGCKSQKAVRIAGDAYKTSDKAIMETQGRRRLDNFKPVTKFQAETKLIGFGSRNVHSAFNTRSVSPARTSHLLYIQ